MRRRASVGGDHPAQPDKTGESRDCRCKEKRRLRASCRAAQGVHPLQDEKEHSESNANAGDLHPRRNFTKRQHRERHREQSLALHDDAGEPDRNAMRDRPGLRQELAEKQRGADRDQHAPRHVRPA